MKKTVLTMMMVGAMVFCFAQQQRPLVDFYPSEKIYEQLTPAQVEQMRTDNPAELLRLNYTLVNSILVTEKPLDGDARQMGALEKYVPKGMANNEDEIIRSGSLNPYKWQLPQDKTQWNVFTLKRSGYYVIVPPETVFNARLQAFLKSYGY